MPWEYVYHHPSEPDTINPNCTIVQTSFKYKFLIRIQLFQIGCFQMPTTRKRKSKTRKSREAERLSDLENMDIMLGSNHLERKDSKFGSFTRRPESPTYDALVDHNTNSHSKSGENEIRRFSENSHNPREIDFSSETNRLSEDINQRVTQE